MEGRSVAAVAWTVHTEDEITHATARADAHAKSGNRPAAEHMHENDDEFAVDGSGSTGELADRVLGVVSVRVDVSQQDWLASVCDARRRLATQEPHAS